MRCSYCYTTCVHPQLLNIDEVPVSIRRKRKTITAGELHPHTLYTPHNPHTLHTPTLHTLTPSTLITLSIPHTPHPHTPHPHTLHTPPEEGAPSTAVRPDTKKLVRTSSKSEADPSTPHTPHTPTSPQQVRPHTHIITIGTIHILHSHTHITHTHSLHPHQTMQLVWGQSSLHRHYTHNTSTPVPMRPPPLTLVKGHHHLYSHLNHWLGEWNVHTHSHTLAILDNFSCKKANCFLQKKFLHALILVL